MKKILPVLTAILLLIFCSFLIIFSKKASTEASLALTVCIKNVIPSLFPYMVISHMTVRSGIGHYVGKLIPISKIYKLPACSSAAVVLGLLCGFPVGCRCAVDLYRSGELSKTEAEVLLSAASNTGPSFVVFIIGAVFFGSEGFGWQIYFSQFIASLIAATIINRILFPFIPTRSPKEIKKMPLAVPDLFSAVSDSVSSTLTVCGFIVFFSVVCGYILPFVSNFSETGAALLSSFLEFTNGARSAASLPGPKGRFLCGFAVGWSGISVLCQCAAFTSPMGLSLKRCICTKLLQGILTGIFCLIPLFPVFSSSPAVDAYFGYTFIPASPALISLFSVFLFGFVIKKLLYGYKIKKHLDL